jgi:hypothetical protein
MLDFHQVFMYSWHPANIHFGTCPGCCGNANKPVTSKSPSPLRLPRLDHPDRSRNGNASCTHRCAVRIRMSSASRPQPKSTARNRTRRETQFPRASRRRVQTCRIPDCSQLCAASLRRFDNHIKILGLSAEGWCLLQIPTLHDGISSAIV